MVNCLEVNYILKNKAYSYLKSSLIWTTKVLNSVNRLMIYFLQFKFCKRDHLKITFIFKPFHIM